jgi:hypothetical protein
MTKLKQVTTSPIHTATSNYKNKNPGHNKSPQHSSTQKVKMTIAYELSAHAFAFAKMLLAEGLGFKPQEFPNSF